VLPGKVITGIGTLAAFAVDHMTRPGVRPVELFCHVRNGPHPNLELCHTRTIARLFGHPQPDRLTPHPRDVGAESADLVARERLDRVGVIVQVEAWR
jgi:hypothetical protein